jgi:hypothetical protein
MCAKDASPLESQSYAEIAGSNADTRYRRVRGVEDYAVLGVLCQSAHIDPVDVLLHTKSC